MSDDRAPAGAPSSYDLRAVTARLADLLRKCRATGSRNDEAGEIEQRISSVLARLTPDPADDGPIPFADLARELYAVERFFESNGFLSVAKEVAHVERSLEALAPTDEVAATTVELPASIDTDGDESRPRNDTDVADDRAASRWAVPRPVAAVLIVFVVALVACAVVIYRFLNPPRPVVAERVHPPPTPTAALPSPTPAPTPAAVSEPRSEAPGAVLAREVGEARLALGRGDVDAVIDHLSRASLIDPDHHTILDAANQLIVLLVERADEAAAGGLFEIAELTLSRATRIANRYGLDTQIIAEAGWRHAQMDRFRIVRPADRDAIRTAAGARVTIVFKDGSTRESVLNGIDGADLLLDEDTEVRGGAMYYIDRVPLTGIDYIKVWMD